MSITLRLTATLVTNGPYWYVSSIFIVISNSDHKAGEWIVEDVEGNGRGPTWGRSKTPWPEAASELYRPSDCRLSATLVPTFAYRRCHTVQNLLEAAWKATRNLCQGIWWLGKHSIRAIQNTNQISFNFIRRRAVWNIIKPRCCCIHLKRACLVAPDNKRPVAARNDYSM
jgi:hypothetical protein